MLRRMLILTLAFLGTSALANPEKDAALFMSNFIDQSYWDYVERKSEQNKTRVYRRALLERNIVIVDKERFHDMIPESAADEAVQRLKSHVATFIIESYGPDPSLHRPYIVEILKTDGILKFPNPALRQSLIKELSVTNP